MKLEKKHYWIGAAALVTLIGVVVYKKRKAKESNTNSFDERNNQLYSDNRDKTINQLIDERESNSPFPIQMGAQGDAVKAIQKYMNSTCPADLKQAGLYPLEVNGVWDENTEKATLACSILKRNKIDKETFDRILRDLQSANIDV